MQKILDHIANVVRPALRNYCEAEKELTEAVKSKDLDAIATARQKATLAARQAATELHHFTDFVFKEKAPPLAFATLDAVRGAVEAKCVLLRTATPIPDVSLLRDVADAFKHHHLDRQSATIAASTDVVSMGTGFGEVAYYGEGKYGGMEQFIITKKDGQKRALSSVLQDVFDAWMTLLGQPLPPMSVF